MNECKSLLWFWVMDTYVSGTRLLNLSGSEKKTRTSVKIAMIRIFLCVLRTVFCVVLYGHRVVHKKPNL